MFYSTTTDAQTNNETVELGETPKTEAAEDGNTADPADGVEGKEGKMEKKPRRRRVPNSSKALKALRQSLALAAEKDAGIVRKEYTRPFEQERPVVTRSERVARRVELALKRKKELEGAEPDETKKETVKPSKTKKGTSKAAKTNVKSDESKSEEPSVVRRMVTKPQHRQLVRRMTAHKSEDIAENGKGKPSSEDSEAQGVVETQDGKKRTDLPFLEPNDWSNPYASAVNTFLKRHPSIMEKISKFREEKDRPGKQVLSMRRTLVGLIQSGQLSRKEKGATMRLLRSSIICPRPLKKLVGMTTEEKSKASVDVLESTTRKAAPSVELDRGRIRPTMKAPVQRAKPGPISAQRGTTKHEIETIEANELELIPIDKEPPKVPSLAYGLERVLFNPGVYHLQEPRSRVFNFDPYLQTIMPVSEFDFNALKQYITSSRDKTLLSKAKEEVKKYTGSTSSMTSALGHFHFLLSQWRPINTGILSQMFPVEFNTFTALQRGPVAVFLRWRDGTYAIDADKEYDDSNILMMLGKSMEKLLTLSTEDFEKYRKANSDQISEEERNESEPFHYTTMGDFLLRSQLDAHDSRLPGTGMFDLKTRAVISVRMDTAGFEEGRGYQIRGRHGEWESFEREYYDMIRSAFLKYSLQVRMGRMDGIFVAFHNTERIFGFQYISLPEMDYALHGTDNTAIGDSEFKLSLELLNRVLDRATAKFPKQSLRLHFETRNGVTPFMYIFAEPVAEKLVEKIQATNKRKIEEFEREVLGVATSKLTEEQKEAEWARLRAKVEEEMQNDELGIEKPNEADAKSEAELDEMVIQEKLKVDELLASTAIEEDREENEEENEDEDTLVEKLEEGDEEILEEEGEQDEEILVEDEAHDEENEDTALEDGDEHLEDNELDEQALLEEIMKDDAEESDESPEEHHLDEQVNPEETLSDDLQEMEEAESSHEQGLEEQARVKEKLTDDVEDSESIQEQDSDEPATAEEIVAQDLEEAGRLEESAEEAPTEQSNEAEPGIMAYIAKLTTDGVLSGTTIKEAVAAAHAKRKARQEAAISKVREARKEAVKAGESTDGETTQKPLLAMTLVIRNKVNNEYVERPESLEGHEKWEVEYALSEISKLESAHKLYEMTKTRRYKALTKNGDLSAKNAWNNTFIASIKKMSEKGRAWRDKQDNIEKQLPVKTLEFKGGKKMKDKDRDLWGQGKKED